MTHPNNVTRSRTFKRFALALCLVASLWLTGCKSVVSQTTEVGAHKITVNYPHGLEVRQRLEEHDDIASLRRESIFGLYRKEIVIKNEELWANGRSYGKLKQGDSVTVDGDRVFINSNEAQEIASR